MFHHSVSISVWGCWVLERILSDALLSLHLESVEDPGSVIPALIAALPGSTLCTVEMAARTLCDLIGVLCADISKIWKMLDIFLQFSHIKVFPS